jgi:hypothetical protein
MPVVGPARFEAKAVGALTPTAGIIKIDPGLISRDPAVVRAYRDDPLVYHGKIPARTVVEVATAIERFSTELPTLGLPLLVMAGTGDRIALLRAAARCTTVLAHRIGPCGSTRAFTTNCSMNPSGESCSETSPLGPAPGRRSGAARITFTSGEMRWGGWRNMDFTAAPWGARPMVRGPTCGCR